MKKIPTLFVRVFEGKKIVDVTPEITEGCREAFENGIATVKIDGSCCDIFDGVFYKRYDCKNGKQPPKGAIPCCDPDPITGHWPHWVQVDPNDPSDKWFQTAFCNGHLGDGTYEAIGPHFQGNPYNLGFDRLRKHGREVVNVVRDFDHIKAYLEEHNIEGLVFWFNGEPVCKIKRSDFGLPWGMKGGKRK